MINIEEYSKGYYVIIALMIVSGSANTIFFNLQNNYYSSKNKDDDKFFNHPWLQTGFMYIGEFYCALIWICFKDKFLKNLKKDELIETNQRQDVSPFLFYVFLSMLCDLIGSILRNISLLFLPGSVFQMLRGGLILITSMYSFFILKKSLKKFQLIGIIIVFIGLFIVGLYSLLLKDKFENYKNIPLGISLLLASLFIQGFQFIFQEKVMNEYNCHPMQLIAWEGTWGLIIIIIVLIFSEFIVCSNDIKDICCKKGDEYYLEKTILAFRQMSEKLPLLFFCLFSTISIGFYNFYGTVLAKLSSSTTRLVMDSARTLVVWIFFLTLHMENGQVLEVFSYQQLIGFLLVIIGQIIYNGLLKFRILGYDEEDDKIDKNDTNISQSCLNNNDD